PLQICFHNQHPTPSRSSLRRLALGLRLRREPASSAYIGILVRRGIHRRHVPDSLEFENPTGARVTVIAVLGHCEGKGHLVYVAPLDKFVQVTAGGRVCQPGPNEQSLIVWDKLESLVSGPRHYHDAVRMIVFEWHISQISTIQ